jgi:hypothetical protein
MVPGSFVGYFVAAAGAAAALIGLLFVAISLRPESVLGRNAPPVGRALAESSFTGLMNAFFLSMVAVVPGASLGVAAGVLGLGSVWNTIWLQRHLGRQDEHRVMLLLSFATFAAELALGGVLIAQPHSTGCVRALCYVVIASFAVALGRAWSLMQGRHLEDTEGAPGGGNGQA